MVSREWLVKGVDFVRKAALLFMPLFLTLATLASFPNSAAAQDDPPGRVARLNYIQGSVSYQVSGDQDWVQANPNRPLTTGDNLWVDRNSRGEVHIGSTAIRLASETGISFLTLDDRTVQMQLAQGKIEVHLRHLSPGDDFEIDTPNLAFTLTRAGEYLIATDPDGGSTSIIVREGQGQVTGGGGSWDLRDDQQYTFTGTQELTYDAAPAPGFDDFEDWCQSRDQRENNAASARYVSRDVDGYYDLDEYGNWDSDPEYGMVWIPRAVPVGWAPYHFGHWVYIEPWGWTWVDEAPWGFAPFHYGRWCYTRNRWAWVPGPMVVRPVYAPALVAFVGGGGFSTAVSFGGGFAGVAWFPLGPRDVFVPAYRCSPRYVQNVNITNTRVVNVTQVTNVYNTVVVNRNVTRINYMYANNAAAVTAVSRETFVNARPVASAAVRVTSTQIERVRVVESAPVAPTRMSYVSPVARRVTTKPAVPFAQRPVVVRLNPAVAAPERRTPEYTNESRPFSQQAIPRGGANVPPPPRTTNAEQPSREGYRPFGPPQPPASANQGQPAGRIERNTLNQPGNHPGNQQFERRPSMRYTPPVKARDEMYDVHGPLNRRQAQRPPKQEERRAQPSRQQPENRKQRDDSKRQR
jgi:Family of unknown function (DUF6600)